MRSISLVLILLCSTTAYSAGTIDFEEHRGLVSTFQPVGVDAPLDDGFAVSANEGVIWLNDEGPAGASIGIGLNNGAVATFSNTIEPSFDFYGFEFFNGGIETITITGEKLSGGSVTTVVDVSSISGFDWTTEAGYTEFTDIVSLSFTAATSTPSSFIFIDNIQANIVPVPAAVWLFGSALAGLGWMRRKQTT